MTVGYDGRRPGGNDLYASIGAFLSTLLMPVTFALIFLACLEHFGWTTGFLLGWISAPGGAILAGVGCWALWGLIRSKRR